jgi:hypothetical protein
MSLEACFAFKNIPDINGGLSSDLPLHAGTASGPPFGTTTIDRAGRTIACFVSPALTGVLRPARSPP